jgi:hypothetical protein
MSTPIVLTVIAVALAIILALKAFLNRRANIKTELADEVQPTNLIGKEKVKLMPYKQALEASKRFMYNISRAVLERFSPSAKASLLALGQRLFKAGVQYLHLVDMFTLSLQRQLAEKQNILQKKSREDKGRNN